MKDLFRGQLVRLTMEEPEFLAKHQARWQRDTEFHRLASSRPAEMFSAKKIQQRGDELVENDFKPQHYPFSIRALDGDRLIGFLNLWLNLIHSEAWLGIGIGEREFWGKGYGTDALKLGLQYAFTELGAQRVSLGVYEYNPRARRAYEKVGFRLEGRTRQDALRDGTRYDSLWMGILREEWIQTSEVCETSEV